MCEAITLLNGTAIDTPAALKELVPDGDMSRVGSHHIFGDDTCLCLTDIGAFLAMSSRRFKEESCSLASIFSTWSEVDTAGRTYGDAFDRNLVSSSGNVVMCQLVRRADWPHGFDGNDPVTADSAALTPAATADV